MTQSVLGEPGNESVVEAGMRMGAGLGWDQPWSIEDSATLKCHLLDMAKGIFFLSKPNSICLDFVWAVRGHPMKDDWL